MLLNKGKGTFGEKTDYITGDNPNSAVLKDLNGDGKPDLVTANEASNSVSILMHR